MAMQHTIFTGLSPNTTRSDVRIARSFLLNPRKWSAWRRGIEPEHAEHMLAEYLGAEKEDMYVFDSGRSALLIALKALGIQPGDEVLVQAFTCVVVINAIKWAGGTPVYVDIEMDTLNMNPQDAEQKITPKTRCMIIQHTFGLPADLIALMDIATRHELRTIEDCAHSLGAQYNGKFTGTYADIGMFSFGTEKIISCVRGGALITADASIALRIAESQEALPEMSHWRVFQHLVHVVSFPFGKKLYHLLLGKLFLKLLKTAYLIPRLITQKEKQGIYVKKEVTKLPNALATLLVKQLSTINTRNAHRKDIAQKYRSTLSHFGQQKGGADHVYLRYAFFAPTAQMIRARAKEQHILLGDWYATVVAPGDTCMRITDYVEGSCPVAEQRASEVVNLPTDTTINQDEVDRILVSLFE